VGERGGFRHSYVFYWILIYFLLKFEIFLFRINLFLVFLNYFNELILKINFKK
jgi:hypothetical protein